MRASEFVKDSIRRIQEEKVDLLLVQCDHFHNIALDNANLGLLSIATYLETKGFKVLVLGAADFHMASEADLRQRIRRILPTVTGFYVVSDNYELVAHQAQLIKSWAPRTRILFGGPLAVSSSEEMLQLPFVDGVVTGEGEYATELICEALCRKKGSLDDVPGLLYKQDGTVRTGPPPVPIEDLDALPPPAVKYFVPSRFFRVISGRGCPYKCTFCFQSGHGLKSRFRSAGNVLDEIVGNFEKGDFNSFAFVDDAFILDIDRCMTIAEGLRAYREASGKEFLFFCQGRVNILEKHPEVIQALAQVGMARMQLGIESGDHGVLQAYNKVITTDQVRSVVRTIRDTGSAVAMGGFILGGPFEDEKTFQNTMDLAVELIETAPGAFYPSAGFLGAYPGTEIAENPDKFGLTQVAFDFNRFASLTEVQFTTERFKTKQEIRKLKKRFDEETKAAMARNVSRIPPNLLYLYYTWAERGIVYSPWYSEFLAPLAVVKQYFIYALSPRFRPSRAIPPRDLGRWYPMRVNDSHCYRDDGSIVLPPSVREVILEKPEEKLMFELAFGKLNMQEIAATVKKELHSEGSDEEVLQNYLLPFLQALEQTYHIIFRE